MVDYSSDKTPMVCNVRIMTQYDVTMQNYKIHLVAKTYI